MSPEETPDQAFIGIDPDDTQEVSWNGATFTVGVLPAGVWDILVSRRMVAYQDAQRRAIAQLHVQGRDPEEETNGISALKLAAGVDAAFLKERLAIQVEAVRLGLRGFTGFKVGKSAKAVPFQYESQNLDGVQCDVVMESTLRYFRANLELMGKLYEALKGLNELGGVAKKA